MSSPISCLQVGLASPQTIECWASYAFLNKSSVLRQVNNAQSLDDAGMPILGGLFCQRIFGPMFTNKCLCDTSKVTKKAAALYEEFSAKKNTTQLCAVCGVEIASTWVRRYRMGAIVLVEPVANVLYFKYLRSALGLSARALKRILFYKDYTAVSRRVSNPKRSDLNLYGGKYIQRLLIEFEDHLFFKYKVLRQALVSTKKRTHRHKTCKRLKRMKIFLATNSKLSWMVLETLPVLPPRLRPFLRLDNDWVCSEVNDHYKTIVIRNNRLLHFKTHYGLNHRYRNPSVYKTKNADLNIILPPQAKKLYALQAAGLQNSVDALIHKPSLPKRLTDLDAELLPLSSGREKSSLTNSLQGKRGLFRKHLLGKRVDFSGRSVIVGAPHLSFGTCGLPLDIVIELYRPFIMGKFEKKPSWSSITDNMHKGYYLHRLFRVWLQRFCSSSYIYLNRAPTLHKFNIQAFVPRVDEGRAIQFFPLACGGFNADFDGDQMGVFLPVTTQGRQEARRRMYTYYQSFSTAHGKLVLSPSQDMITGLHLLRNDSVVSISHNHHYYASVEDIWTSIDAGLVDLRSLIWFRNENSSSFIISTAGRLILSLAAFWKGSE